MGLSVCDRCGGTGKLSFVKEGKVISHAFVYCGCQNDTECYQTIKTDDFDYPMSDTFRAHSFVYCGQRDPGYTPEPVDNSITL